jgi:hypothetical protein
MLNLILIELDKQLEGNKKTIDKDQSGSTRDPAEFISCLFYYSILVKIFFLFLLKISRHIFFLTKGIDCKMQ